MPRGKGCLDHISDAVLHVKSKFSEVYICVTGDFNQWQVQESLEDYPDLQEVVTPPTRKDRRIDRIFVNWETSEADCLPPLKTAGGDVIRRSDHLVQYCNAELPGKPVVVWRRITCRPFTSKGAKSFREALERQDWREVFQATGPNQKERVYQAIIDGLMETHFPTKITRVKDDDLPWMDDEARKRIRKKKAVFKAEARSPRWEAIRKNIDTYLEKRREKFLERQKENLTGPDASRQFFRNVKDFKTHERSKAFDIKDILPGLSDQAAAERAAEYFNKISQEFSPLKPSDVPTTYDKYVPLLSVENVELRLKRQKKPNSMVMGDIFPKLVNDCAKFMSVPLSDVYNEIIKTNVWPISWKREYVTIIPKKKLPEGMEDLRNISCTRFISKVFESYVMEQILEEITVKRNQFGGIKGCSTGHMLVELWQDICENSEDYRCGTVLTGIDYAKAFNRLSFQHCLEAFRRKGASTAIIRLISTFLTNRSMTVRVGNSWSMPREVNGGCPQGSILGVLLFNITTDDLEDNFLASERIRLEEQHDSLPDGQPDEGQPLPDRQHVPFGASTPERETVGLDLELSPVERGFYEHDGTEIAFIAGTRNQPRFGLSHDSQVEIPDEIPAGNQTLVKKAVVIRKYVDDCVSSEKLNFGDVEAEAVGGELVKRKQARGSQNAYRSTTRNAFRKGMVVNERKTNILCISDALNYKPEAYIFDNSGLEISSGKKMRILGFDFSEKPTVHSHVDSIRKRIRQRYWVLRHLAKFGMSRQDLVKVYNSMIVPIADYCDFVYHSMLTDEQDELLENSQVGALRVIFGYGISGRRLREMANVKTLRSRRIEHCDNFARKAAADAHFSKWFPKKNARASARNNPEVYREEYARCDRLKNSPIFYMRRRLNGKQGKNYGERYRIYRER